MSLDDVGILFKVTLDYEPEDIGESKLFVKKLTLKGDDRREKYKFEFKSSLSADRGPHFSLACDIAAESDGLKVKAADAKEYNIDIKTSDVKGQLLLFTKFYLVNLVAMSSQRPYQMKTEHSAGSTVMILDFFVELVSTQFFES